MNTALQHVAKAPKEIKPILKRYAFERSLGIPQREACRRAGGKDDSGAATRWERMRGVQLWIEYYRSMSGDDEIRAAKRQRIEDRLTIAAFGNIFDYSTIDDLNNDPKIDWRKIAESPFAAAISRFKFDKDTGRLTDFERDDALQALAQLRDMHGFKSVNKTALTDPSGENPASMYLISERPMTEDEWEAQRASTAE